MRFAAVAVSVVCALVACGCGGASTGCTGGVYTDGACIPAPAVYTSEAARARRDGALWFLGGRDPGSMFGRSDPLYHIDPGSTRPTPLTLPQRLWSVTSLAVSPDSRLIALSNDGGEFPPRNVYVMRTDGTGLRQITHGNLDEIDPSWSPDSHWIGFSTTRPTCTCSAATAEATTSTLSGHLTGRGSPTCNSQTSEPGGGSG